MVGEVARLTIAVIFALAAYHAMREWAVFTVAIWVNLARGRGGGEIRIGIATRLPRTLNRRDRDVFV